MRFLDPRVCVIMAPVPNYAQMQTFGKMVVTRNCEDVECCYPEDLLTIDYSNHSEFFSILAPIVQAQYSFNVRVCVIWALSPILFEPLTYLSR